MRSRCGVDQGSGGWLTLRGDTCRLFTFTLLDQVDHTPLGSGAGDTETILLSLASVFVATDFDGDSLVVELPRRAGERDNRWRHLLGADESPVAAAPVELDVTTRDTRVRTAYDATFVLSPDRQRYIAQNNNTPTNLPAPGLPFSLVFRAEPGAENRILRVASAYEAASKRRVSPPEFGPLKGTS